MRILCLLVATLSITACSSEYSPGEKMRALKADMTSEQAVAALQTAIWGADALGICGSRGFWYDNNADIRAHADKITLLAHKRGKVLRKYPKKIGEVVVFEKQYYRYALEFDAIERIHIYDDPQLLPTFPDCNKKDLEKNYYIVDLYVDEQTNLKFIVPENAFDRTMAAITLLLPDTPIEMERAWVNLI